MNCHPLMLSSASALALAVVATALAGAKPPPAHAALITQAPATDAASAVPAPQKRGVGGGPTQRADVLSLYASIGRGSPINPSAVATLDATTFAGTLVGTPTTQGLNGLTFTSDGRLWASSGGFFGGRSRLHEIDLATGASLSNMAIKVGGTAITLTDLATQPGTDKVYGFAEASGRLYTIDTTSGAATLVGVVGTSKWGGIAFAPDGTLYHTSTFSSKLLTLDPATGATLSSVSTCCDGGLHGLEVRPTDGVLIATRGGGYGGDAVVTIDPVTGRTTSLGATGVGTASDIAIKLNTCQLDLGFGGPGTTTLQVCGDDLLVHGNTATLRIDSPVGGFPAFLVVGPAFTPMPFLGGTLVPSGAPFVIVNYVTDGAGDVVTPITAPGVSPQVLYVQAAVFDVTLPGLIQISNALQVVISL